MVWIDPRHPDADLMHIELTEEEGAGLAESADNGCVLSCGFATQEACAHRSAEATLV